MNIEIYTPVIKSTASKKASVLNDTVQHYKCTDILGRGSALHLTSAAHVASTHPLLLFFCLRFVSPSSVGMCHVIKK